MEEKKICINCPHFRDAGPVSAHLSGIEGTCEADGHDIGGALQECDLLTWKIRKQERERGVNNGEKSPEFENGRRMRAAIKERVVSMYASNPETADLAGRIVDAVFAELDFGRWR